MLERVDLVQLVVRARRAASRALGRGAHVSTSTTVEVKR